MCLQGVARLCDTGIRQGNDARQENSIKQGGLNGCRAYVHVLPGKPRASFRFSCGALKKRQRRRSASEGTAPDFRVFPCKRSIRPRVLAVVAHFGMLVFSVHHGSVDQSASHSVAHDAPVFPVYGKRGFALMRGFGGLVLRAPRCGSWLLLREAVSCSL